MTDIYSSASQVLVWIGPESQSTSLALSNMQTISANVNVDWGRYCFVDDPDPSDPYSWSDPKVSLLWTDEATTAICELLKRNWFGRLWIWQELYLAQDVVVLCGSHTFPFDYVGDTVFAIALKPKTPLLNQHLESCDLQKVFNLCGRQTDRPILGLLRDSTQALCSDPRDRIYALLSLDPQAERIFRPK